MTTQTPKDCPDEHCCGCVYYPPNLPPSGYSAEDFRMLQEKTCSFDYLPGDSDCNTSRKTSCFLVDLEHLNPSISQPENKP